MKNIPPVFLVFFSISFCGILLIIIKRFRQRAILVKHGIRVKGTIVAFTGNDLMNRYPMVRFQTPAGKLLTLTLRYKVSVLEYKKGQIVDISYPEANPEEFIIMGGMDSLFE